MMTRDVAVAVARQCASLVQHVPSTGWEGCHHIDFPAGLGNQTLGSTGPIATPVGPPGALACSRLKSIIQASQFNVVAAPTPGGGGRPEGTKPPLLASYAVQKPASIHPEIIPCGDGGF